LAYNSEPSHPVAGEIILGKKNPGTGMLNYLLQTESNESKRIWYERNENNLHRIMKMVRYLPMKHYNN